MKFVRIVFSAALPLALLSCRPLSPEVTSQDCVQAVPAGFTRIFIGTQPHTGQPSGTSFNDPLDGSTGEKFDAILRSISEGLHPTWGTQSNIQPENLIVCMTSGTFQTFGQYNLDSDPGSALGFTMEKNWKIHGRGVNQTKLQLAGFLPDQFVDQKGAPFRSGRNVVLATHSTNASGIEISDLTVDANHDQLTTPGGLPLNLEGIVLRSAHGGHWIHDVTVTGGSGDAGFINVIFETFAVQLWGDIQPLDPQQNTANIIENVTVSNPGQAVVSGSPPGGAMDGIVVNGAVAEVRKNVVDGYQVGYGGWAMGPVWFHDNISRNTQYGFNADSFNNQGVIVQANQFIHPSRYGIVLGGSDLSHSFSNWSVQGNSISLNTSNSAAIVLRGQVRDAIFSDNTIASDAAADNQIAIWSYAAVSGLMNVNNTFQNNHIDRTLSMSLSQDPNFSSDCRFQNRDLQGRPRPDFPDNSSAQCR